MSTIPETWQPKPHYEVGITWFIRKPNEREVMGEEFAAEESKEFSGWHFFLRTNEDLLYDRLEDAIGKIKTTLKHWRMQNPFGIERVPIQVSKKERKQMVVQLLEYPITHPDDESEILRLKWEFGEYMLVVSIWHVPFAEEFITTMNSPDNPIKSLVGKVCTLYGATQADLDLELDDDDYHAEWREIATGPVTFEDHLLCVGLWSQAFEASTAVIGVAYEEASFEDEKMRYHLVAQEQK